MKQASIFQFSVAAVLICRMQCPTTASETTALSQPVYPVTTAAPAKAPAMVAPEATPAPPPSAPPTFSASELEQLAMPIALYPDILLAILLPASVFPMEIVQAARFVKDTNNLAKLDEQPWDEKVRAVARFPDVINMMNTNLEWTVKLGQAFLEQPLDLMNAIQSLRGKAQSVGTLKTTPQQVVTVTNAVVERTYESQIVYVTNTVIQVEPASKEVVYVPTYNPTTVYVEEEDNEAAEALVTFGVAFGMTAIIANNCDWYYGGCYWGHYPPPPPPMPPPYYPPPGTRPPSGTRPPGGAGGPGGIGGPGGPGGPGGIGGPGGPGGVGGVGGVGGPGKPGGVGGPSRPSTQPSIANATPTQRWQPDKSRLQNSGAPVSAQNRETRGWGGATAQPAQRSGGVGAGAGPSVQPQSGWQGSSSAGRGGTASAGNRPSGAWSQQAANRPSASSFDRSDSRSSSAFGGMSSGGSERSFSNRGAASRGGGGRGGGGRGGGRGR